MNNLSAWQILIKKLGNSNHSFGTMVDVNENRLPNYTVIASLHEYKYRELLYLGCQWQHCVRQREIEKKQKEIDFSNQYSCTTGIHVEKPFEMVCPIFKDLFFLAVNETVDPLRRSVAAITVFSGWRIACKNNSLINFGIPVFEEKSTGSDFCNDLLDIFKGLCIFKEELGSRKIAANSTVVGQVTDPILKQIVLLFIEIESSFYQIDPWPTKQEEMHAFKSEDIKEYFRFMEERNRLYIMLGIMKSIMLAGILHNLDDEQIKAVSEINRCAKRKMGFLIANDWNIIVAPA